MSATAIHTEALSKRYHIGGQRGYGTLRDTIMEAVTSPIRKLRSFGRSSLREEDTIWALRDVSFEVQPGEVVGIIGRNGAGKSTLLKVLTRITEPTTGWAQLRGRVGSLLEVGTGFHPELTGRENIFLSGAILGMSRREIKAQLDEIIDFSGVSKFIDTPVKRYSSGMRVRLGFAVAAHLRPEILLIDEVLAVGDVEFQKRCVGKMGHVAKEGRTVLFVSHNMKAVSGLCHRAILLDEGAIVAQGPTNDVIQSYLQRLSMIVDQGPAELAFEPDPGKAAQISTIRIRDRDGSLNRRIDLMSPIELDIDFVVRSDFPHLLLWCDVRSADGTIAFTTSESDWRNYNREELDDDFPMAAGEYSATLKLPGPMLNEGTYEIEVYLTTGPAAVDRIKGIMFEVVDNSSYANYIRKSKRGGILCTPFEWEIRRRQ
jgi:lipopolysaccharide transport system ATP-binding protein